MGRGPKPTKGKAKPAVSRQSPKSDDARVRDLEKRLAEAQEQLRTRDTELVQARQQLKVAHVQATESLEQQAATSEILRVIAGSPTDPQPVFDAILKRAATLCEAQLAHLWLYEGGEQFRLGAGYGSRPDHLQWLQQGLHRIGQPFFRESGPWRVGQVLDVRDTEPYRRGEPLWIRTADHEGMRTLLGVPLVKDGRLVGSIAVYRREVQPFTDQQTALVQTFADQAVIAIENVRLFNETKEALDRQTATAEILRVISSSPTDVQPVFDAIASNAVRLCESNYGVVHRFDGTNIGLPVAMCNVTDEQMALYRRIFPLAASMDNALGESALTRRTVQIEDTQAERRYTLDTEAVRVAREVLGYRTVLMVPMVRRDQALGIIAIWRREQRPFSPGQIALVETFADQAVIAIENVRLFKELEARNRALTEALERQTATAEILSVISSSPTGVQPTFDAIARSAALLCRADLSGVHQFDGQLIHFAAQYGRTAEEIEAVRQAFPQRPSRASATARCILSAAVVQIADHHDDPDIVDSLRMFRTVLAVPMLREGQPVGSISVARRVVEPFTEDQVALLETFADQAVIAIENVRLFTELRANNRALTQAHAQVSESLEQQTATAEILRVISSSPTDVQPVFDTIVERAARLCDAEVSLVARLEGDWIHVGAVYGTSVAGTDAVRRTYPMRPGAEGATARAIRDSTIAHIPDVLTDREFTIRDAALAAGFRAVLAVPMLREGRAIGAISIGRAEAGEFSTEQVNLLRTFADQAIIAIENVRLFKELEARTQDLTRSVGELRALSEVGQAISSTLDLQTVLRTIVARATQLAGVDAGVIYEYDEQTEIFVPRATERLEVEIVETLIAAPVRKGEGATGRLAEAQAPIQLSDILEAPAESRVRETLGRAGYRALLAVPLVREGHLIGGLTVFRKAPGEFAPELIDLLQTFATQSGLAIQNARLFRELADKSRQLEAASQHKSEFLANMSHELRTPLNAIIGFSEVLSERMFGELNEKQDEYLKDIHASGQHLLSLINDILDLSKIEAGRMELELSDFDLPLTIDNALTLIRERAGRRGIALHTTVDERLAQIQADERKIRQVLLNLLSNAIKFTPEGGKIAVEAKPVAGSIEVSVSDTGIGIAPEDQEAVFEEFRQVGTADKKVEGTGLGLALSRKFIELHGGRIWVKSEVGEGSTFTFTIPVRRGE
jgi:GAF domain-containing protein